MVQVEGARGVAGAGLEGAAGREPQALVPARCGVGRLLGAQEHDQVVQHQAVDLEQFSPRRAPKANLVVEMQQLAEALVLQQIVLGEARLPVVDGERVGREVGVDVEQPLEGLLARQLAVQLAQ